MLIFFYLFLWGGCCCGYCCLDITACCRANGVSQKQGSTFIPPAEDTPVNPFLRRRGSLNNKRAGPTRPFSPGAEGARAAPPSGSHQRGVSRSRGAARTSRLSVKLQTDSKPDLREKRNKKKKSPAPPDTRTESTPPTRGRLSQSVKALHTSSAGALSRLATDVASFAPLRSSGCG